MCGCYRFIVRLFALCLLGASPLAAAADETAVRADLKLLVDSPAKEQPAILQRLVASHDGRLADALDGYRIGTLWQWNDQLVFAQESYHQEGQYQLYDALTSEPILQADKPVTVEKSELKMLVASRKQRRDVVQAIRVLELYSPDVARRGEAIKKIGDLQSTEYLDELQEVIEGNPDTRTLYRAQESIALIRLATGTPAQQLAAATELGNMASARATPLIQHLLQEAYAHQADAGTLAIYSSALNKIESYQERIRVLSYIFSGLSLGSVLLLMALGLSIVFGQMGVINMAHGELMMIGAYATYEVQRAFGHALPDHPVNIFFLVALPCSFLAAAVVGWLMERFIVRHLYGRPLETLLATWGAGLMLIQIVRLRYGDNIGVNSPTWLVSGAEVIQDLYIPYNRIFIIGLTVLCVAFVYWLLNATKRGLLLRATVQNREMAAALGVNTRYEDGFTFAFGAGLAGIAGCALTLIGGVTPDMGQNYIVDSFLVVVTGGVGEVAGAVWAGLGLGVMNKILEPIFSTIWSKVLILAFVIAFIQYRPAGLFPPKGRLADV